jgi:hypothetical protein
LETGAGKNNQYVLASIYSDEVIGAYLTLSQSFAIVVDAASFYARKHHLERGMVPGRYFSGQPQRFPMMGALGRLWDYRLSQEEDTYVYGSEPIHDAHYLFQTTDYKNQLSIAGSREGALPWSNANAYLLEFGTYV